MLDFSAKTVMVDGGSVDDVRLSTLKKPSRSVELLAKKRSNEDAFKEIALLIIHGKFVGCVYCQCCVSDDVVQVCDAGQILW